jgi:hypothetical protein
MKKITAFFAFFVLFASILTISTTRLKPVEAAEEVTIVNHQGFLNSAGKYVVYGEVRNTGDVAAKNVHVDITFYNSLNAVLDEGEYAIRVNVLPPGRKAPFGAVAGVEGTLVKAYTVELMNLTLSADALPLGLEIVSSSAEVKTQLQSVMLNGQVKNIGTQNADYVKVIATFYEGPSGTGNVVGVASPSAEPDDLNPGQTGTFEAGIAVGLNKSYGSYVLTAESLEYSSEEDVVAVVPEFSSLIILPLLIVATLVVAVVLKAGKTRPASTHWPISVARANR